VENFEVITRYLAFMSAHIAVIDLGPAISPISDRILTHCDEVVVLLEPVPNTIVRTQLLLDELAKKGFGEGRVNSILYNRQRTEMQYSLAQVQMEYRHPISIVLPLPELAYQYQRQMYPLSIQHPDNLTHNNLLNWLII
jgi:MinD-like ATPase involved in chromosome partitioning or flagellar assembly